MKHIKALLCIGIASALGATAWVAIPSDAEARSQSAMLGSARNLTDAACFDEADGGVKRISACTGNKVWEIPLVYDSAGWLNLDILVKGSGGGANKVTCTAYAFFSNGTVSNGDWDENVLTNGAWEHLSLSIYAESAGGAFVRCSMGPDTRVLQMTY